MKTRYADVINPKPEEARTGEEIIEQIRSKLRGGAKNELI